MWTESEKRSWNPIEKLSPSQWCERNRTLPPTIAAESGQLRLDRTPYMRGILDAINEPGVEEIAVIKPTQIGYSTALETWIGWAIDQEPGPILLVLDSQKSAQEVIAEKIRPMVELTPAVNQHQPTSPHDDTLNAIRFDTAPLYVGWAGSPASLSRRAIRYALFDEVDKYPPFSGREAEPIALGTERTATYGYRRRVLLGSTPTTRTGAIWRAWEAAGDKRTYHVPCPHCGEFQPLIFSQIKWPTSEESDRFKRADAIEQNNLAHYECSKCNQPIRDHHKPKMLLAGVWLSDGQSIDRHGVITGTRPRAKRVGFQLNALYSPWRSFSAIAGEFQRSQNDPGRMQNFWNSWLGVPFEEQTASPAVDDFRQLTIGAPEAGTVPMWADFLVASVDVQKDRLYWVVRCWAAEWQSQLIAHGIVLTFDELRQQVLNRPWKHASGSPCGIHLMAIDSGYRTTEVYDFARTDERIRPVKGEGNDNQPMLVKYSSAGKAYGVPLFMLNTQLLQDKLHVIRNVPGRWLLNNAVTDDYLQMLASHHKVVDRKTGRESWKDKTSGIQDHYLDAELYSLAAAEMLNVGLLVAPDSTPEA
jgi:phage terminase large subunit GpA-like protein